MSRGGLVWSGRRRAQAEPQRTGHYQAQQHQWRQRLRCHNGWIHRHRPYDRQIWWICAATVIGVRRGSDGGTRRGDGGDELRGLGDGDHDRWQTVATTSPADGSLARVLCFDFFWDIFSVFLFSQANDISTRPRKFDFRVQMSHPHEKLTILHTPPGRRTAQPPHVKIGFDRMKKYYF